MPEGAIVVDESVTTGRGFFPYSAGAPPHDWLNNMGGSIGFGGPVAVGAAVACPNRKVIAMIGDGSAMYTNQALWTAARESLAVVYVIFNNASYRILKQRTHALKGVSAEDDVYVGMDLDRPLIDFVGLAKSLGVPGEHVEKTADVGPAVTRALKSGGPYLVDVRIDSTFK